MIFDILLTIIFFCFFIKLAKKNVSKTILIFSSTIFYFVISILSLIVIENGIYISELDVISYRTNGFWKYILYLAIFIYSFYKFKPKKQEIDSINNNFINNFVYNSIGILSFGILAYLYIDLLVSGIPILNGNDFTRLNFYINSSKLPFTSICYTLCNFYFPIIYGVYFINGKNDKKKTFSLIFEILLCIYLVLIGFKFSGLKTAIINFIIPIIYLKYLNNEIKINFKLFKKVVRYIALFAVIIIVNYSLLFSNRSSLDLFKNRVFALTSHFWWVTENYVRENPVTYDDATNNFQSNFNYMLNGESVFSKNTGVVKLMYKFTNDYAANYYVSHNTRMATNFITTSLYDYGYIFTIFVVIGCAALYSYLISSYSKAIRTADVIELILSFKLLIYYETFLWASGTINEFFNKENLVIFIFLLIYKKLNKKQYN